MALSIFMRAAASQTTGCLLMRPLTQGSVRLSSSLLHAAPATQISNKISNYQPIAATPILNSIRSLRLSAVSQEYVRADTKDHTKLWVIEKGVSAALLALVPVALIFPSKILDTVLAITMVSHIYWGLEAIVVDYVRAVIFGPVIPKVMKGLLIALMVITLGGLYNLIFHDIGIANTVLKLWTLGNKKQEA